MGFIVAGQDITWDQSRFDKALEEYVKVSSRDFVTILNTKGYHVARRAIYDTKKASAADIKSFMSTLVTVTKEKRVNKDTGRKKSFKVNTYSDARTNRSAPGMALVINANRGSSGKKGLQGRQMQRAMDGELARRMKSIAYLKSGWIAAVRGLETNAEEKAKARADRGVTLYGVPAGKYQKATPDSLICIIENHAKSDTDVVNRWKRFLSQGLQAAVDAEAASMEEYTERKLSKSIADLNKKL